MTKKIFRKVNILIVAILLVVVTALAGCDEGRSYTQRSEVVFGSGIVFTGKALGVNADIALEEMVQLLRRINDATSLTKNTSTSDESPIKEFNDMTELDKRIEIDKIAYDVINSAKQIKLDTGVFDISLTPLSALWGVDADSISGKVGDIVDSIPSVSEVQTQLATCNLDNVVTEAIERGETCKYYIYKTAPVSIDLGGIIKGYGADLCKDIAVKYNLESCQINISGNLYLYKKMVDKSGGEHDWQVAIRDPRSSPLEPEKLCGFAIADTSIVTSGDYERFVYYKTINNKYLKLPHIIDPRTGCPMGITIADGEYVQSPSSVSSATIISDSSMLADAYATAVCILGLEDGIKLLRKAGLSGIIFTNDMRYATTGGIVLNDKDTNYKNYTLVTVND